MARIACLSSVTSAAPVIPAASRATSTMRRARVPAKIRNTSVLTGSASAMWIRTPRSVSGPPASASSHWTGSVKPASAKSCAVRIRIALALPTDAFAAAASRPAASTPPAASAPSGPNQAKNRGLADDVGQDRRDAGHAVGRRQRVRERGDRGVEPGRRPERVPFLRRERAASARVNPCSSVTIAAMWRTKNPDADAFRRRRARRQCFRCGRSRCGRSSEPDRRATAPARPRRRPSPPRAPPS